MKLYVHLDLDVLDPDECPSVGCDVVQRAKDSRRPAADVLVVSRRSIRR